MDRTLSAAFGVGFMVFPAHWAWTVFTAFIVCSGARNGHLKRHARGRRYWAERRT